MFTQMDSDRAYLLGFLATDGHCGERAVELSLQIRDASLVYSLAAVFARHGYQPTVKTLVRQGKEYIRLRVNSTELVRELRTLGFASNKTFSIPFFNWIPNEFMRDYIRGLYDGDGCIQVRRNNLEMELVSASLEFLRGFNDYLPTIGVDSKNIGTRKRDRRNPLYRLSLYSHDARRLSDFLYYDRCLSLQRKYETIKSFVQQPDPKLWPSEDVDFLLANFHAATCREIADKLKRTLKSVQMKATHLGLRK